MLYPSLERRGQLAASDDHGQHRRPSQALKVKKSAGVLDSRQVLNARGLGKFHKLLGAILRSGT